ncbi:MAG: TIGR01777 family oxidoreductase [Ignavibacteria bacterium]
MSRNILIGGISGLIGSKLAKFLTPEYKIRGLVRDVEKAKSKIPFVDFYSWNDDESLLINLIEDTDILVNLSGRSIAKGRWTEKTKREIYTSRIETTKKLVELISKSSKKPESFIVASAVGYYGFDINNISDENSPPSDDFLGKVCVDWENASSLVDQFNVRRVNVRISTVLSRDGGALPLISLPFKFFVGGYFGSGNQFFPWIHEKDLIRLFKFVIENNSISGPINAVSPQAVTMKEFCETLGKVLKRPCWIRIPEWKMKLLLGEMADLLIKGGKVIPKKALEVGFEFEFESLELALKDLFRKF